MEDNFESCSQCFGYSTGVVSSCKGVNDNSMTCLQCRDTAHGVGVLPQAVYFLQQFEASVLRAALEERVLRDAKFTALSAMKKAGRDIPAWMASERHLGT